MEMPIYEYKCQSCDNRFEVLTKIGGDGEGLSCPNCSSDKLTRLVSSFFARSRAGGSSAQALGSACSTCSGGDCKTCR